MDLAPHYPSSPGMVRLAVAARACGLSEELFEDACVRRQIAIRIERLGARGDRFVRVSELSRYLAPKGIAAVPGLPISLAKKEDE